MNNENHLIMEVPKVDTKYKDKLFRMIFQEKKELLSLYNAMNGTDYQNPNELEVTTLENAIYMNMKNDISFVVDAELNLYEHQSTFNPNMPLRNLFYISRLLEKLTSNQSLYGISRIQIPAPRFVVFYNGADEMPEHMTLKLSDAYEKHQTEPELELKVLMLNINLGKNQELLEKCKTLQEYMIYVTKVRTYAVTMDIQQAVERAVNECIKQDILKDFLFKYKAEAIQMSIFEYDEEKEMRLIKESMRKVYGKEGLEEGRKRGLEEGRKEGLEEGRKEGLEEGKKEGMEQGIARGIEALILDNLEDGTSKERILEKLQKRFNLNPEQAQLYYDKYAQ